MGGEVSNRMLREQLRVVRRRGWDEVKLLAGLHVTAAEVESNPRGFMSWDDYMLWLDHVQEAAGGPEGMEDFASDMIVGAPITQLIARQMVNPARLYTFVADRLTRRMFTMVGTRVDRLTDGRLSYRLSVPSPYRQSLAIYYGSIGALRAYTVLLGLPPALIDGSFSPEETVYRITPPASDTLLARAARAIPPRFVEMLKRSPAATEADRVDTLDVIADSSSLAAGAVVVGRRLAEHADLDALAEDVIAVLREKFLCSYVRLYLRRAPEGRLERFGALGSQALERCSERSLTVGDLEVGRLDLDLGLEDEMPSPMLDNLLPWIALGVQRCLSASTAKPPSPQEFSVPPTAREREVLELLVRGSSNKEIACALGCSVRTVECHVARLMEKSGAGSRAVIIAQVLGAGLSADRVT
ncbi:MAG: LuxR C-terminal-related transcriptional regulator [Myxococcales bacterium]